MMLFTDTQMAMPQLSPDFQEMVRDIAERLRPVCADLSDVEFDALVQTIAATKQKFLLRDHAEAVLRSALGLDTGPHLARRLGSIPRARPNSSVPPRSKREPPAAPPP
jgi:hypothetical protein